MKNCTRCKVDRDDNEFINKYKIPTSHCIKCRETKNRYNIMRKSGQLTDMVKLRNARLEAIERGMFICSTCKGEKVLDQFKLKSLITFGINTACKACLKDRHKYCKIKILYGIDKETHTKFYKDRDGKCDICRRELKMTSDVIDRNSIGNVDHCHITGKVRGLLCNDCNRGLGFFKDNIELVKIAYEYLLKHI